MMRLRLPEMRRLRPAALALPSGCCPDVEACLASGTLLLEAAGIETARLDAECLAAHALGWPRWQIVPHPRRRLTPEEFGRYLALLGRRERREPLAYVLGMREFWSLSLSVSSGVLVPRPETETLVEATLAVWSEMQAEASREPRATSHEPRATSHEPRIESRESRVEHRGTHDRGALHRLGGGGDRPGHGDPDGPHPGDGRLVAGPQSGARQCPGPRGRRPDRVPSREFVAGGGWPGPGGVGGSRGGESPIRPHAGRGDAHARDPVGAAARPRRGRRRPAGPAGDHRHQPRADPPRGMAPAGDRGGPGRGDPGAPPKARADSRPVGSSGTWRAALG